MDADPLAREYDTLLPGELKAARSNHPEDAELWVKVYAELCAFKEKLLEQLVDQRGRVSPPGQLEIEHDEILFQREYGRLKRRLDFWSAEKKKRAA